VVCRNFYTTIYTGWTSHSASSSSCVCWCSSVYTALHRSILPRAMCTGRRRHGPPQSALCHSRTTKFSSVQHDKLWPTSILVRLPSCLELTARTSATNHSNRAFQGLSKTFLFGHMSRSVHETFCLMGYIRVSGRNTTG